MGEFQSLKQIDGLEMASVLQIFINRKDDLALFYFRNQITQRLLHQILLPQSLFHGTIILIKKLLKVC